MSPILEVKNLYKNYGSTEVLKNINVSIEKGDFLVLVGPSGCGKSTLLNCIAGLEPITGGDMFIGGQNMTNVSPKDRDMDKLTDMVRGVADLGLETCMTLGMLSPEQVTKLKEAGLDFYNHNIDTSPEYYAEIASTRTMEDRLETVEHVRKGGIKVCCGGILGMGEAEADRISMLVTLATLPSHPDSVPVNLWNAVKGVPVQGKSEKVDPFALVRLVALARILMPASVVRLSAGRTGMSDELQSLCFLAGANSIFVGNQLLTTENPATWKDNDLLQRLGMHVAPAKPGSGSAKIAAQ